MGELPQCKSWLNGPGRLALPLLGRPARCLAPRLPVSWCASLFPSISSHEFVIVYSTIPCGLLQCVPSCKKVRLILSIGCRPLVRGILVAALYLGNSHGLFLGRRLAHCLIFKLLHYSISCSGSSHRSYTPMLLPPDRFSTCLSIAVAAPVNSLITRFLPMVA